MIKMFYSGTYPVRHELINESNVCELLKDDIRAKITGSVEGPIYASEGVVLKNNKNVMYIGGFYFEKQDENMSECENIVSEELGEIEKCDLLVANLTKYSAIASITEILYASHIGKKIVVFCDPNVTSFKVEGEYWFSILAAKKMNNNIDIKYVNSEDEIVNYIHNLKEA